VFDAFVESEIRAVVRLHIKKLGVNFFGGEPLLQEGRIVELTQLAKHLSLEQGVPVEIGITTNGTLLSGAFLNWCRREGVRILLSLDSPPELHDRYRGGGKTANSFAEITNRIRGFEKDLVAVTTITRQTASIREALDTLLSVGFSKVCFNLVHSRDRELSFQPEDVRRIVEEWEQEQGWFSQHAAQIGNLCDMHEVIRRRTPRYRPCLAGGASYAIGPDAKRYFCHGAIGDASLELFKVASNCGGERDVCVGEGLDSSECMCCWARGLCGGDCWLIQRGYSAQERRGRCELICGLVRLALSTFMAGDSDGLGTITI
jgi:uncharacterized protein